MKHIINSFVIMVALLVTSSVPAFAFYSDMTSNHWAYKQIKQLSEQSVVIGYPDGTFNPDENVTRAEFASMAIKALGQEHATIAQPVKFKDVNKNFWAYNAIQKAIYFDLISDPDKDGKFRPYDSVSRAEALTIAVNALTTEQISEQKAKYVLSKVYKDSKDLPSWFIVAKYVLSKVYKDSKDLPSWFIVPAGKAEILGMIVCAPEKTGLLDAERPATRAEVTAILYNMMEQAKLNPNAKLADAMRKKTGEGYVIEKAFVQGAVGTIPAGSVIPIKVANVMGSQISKNGDQFIAKTPEHFITKDKYILLYKGTDVKGQVCQAKPGRLFIRNGILTLSTDTIVTPNDQAVVEFYSR